MCRFRRNTLYISSEVIRNEYFDIIMILIDFLEWG